MGGRERGEHAQGQQAVGGQHAGQLCEAWRQAEHQRAGERRPRTVGARAAFAGALMLCLSPRFAQLARMLTTNSLLTLCVLAALAAAHIATVGRVLRRRWWLLSAAACGLGLLTKGPVAFVLIAGPIVLQQWLDRRTARITIMHWLVYSACAGAIALPWFVAVAIRDPYF